MSPVGKLQCGVLSEVLQGGVDESPHFSRSGINVRGFLLQEGFFSEKLDRAKRFREYGTVLPCFRMLVRKSNTEFRQDNPVAAIEQLL